MDTKVCIIGAGVSGLKAAHTLLKHNFAAEEIVILEAQNYIGGRVVTDKTSSKLGHSYDIGGAWFHDSLTNVVLKESLEDGSIDFHKDGYYDDLDFEVLDNTGKVPYVGQKLNRVVEELLKFIEIYYYETLDHEDMTLLQITDIYLQKYGYRLTSQQHKYLKALIRMYELWFGIAADQLSAKYTLMSHQGRDLYNRKGMSFLIDKLLKDIPESRIWLNQQVKKVKLENREGRRLRVETQHKTVSCDYVIVTVPLSILSLPDTHDYGIKWEPPLPDSLTSAISKVHFGALGKVIFEFSDVWWDKTIDRFLLLPEDHSTDKLSKPFTELPKTRRYPILAVNYASMHSDKKINGGSLVLLMQSPLTDYIEAHPEEAWTYFKPMFEPLVVKGLISDPINVITTKWTQNPFIRGSYTALHPGDDAENAIAQLSGEIEGIGISNGPIRFAGEHTIAEGDGCIHGAYMSGEREAKWILHRENKL